MNVGIAYLSCSFIASVLNLTTPLIFYIVCVVECTYRHCIGALKKKLNEDGTCQPLGDIDLSTYLYRWIPLYNVIYNSNMTYIDIRARGCFP